MERSLKTNIFIVSMESQSWNASMEYAYTTYYDSYASIYYMKLMRQDVAQSNAQ
jgi:hypothetical protein